MRASEIPDIGFERTGDPVMDGFRAMEKLRENPAVDMTATLTAIWSVVGILGEHVTLRQNLEYGDETDLEESNALLRGWGVPEEVIESIQPMARVFKALPEEREVDGK